MLRPLGVENTCLARTDILSENGIVRSLHVLLSGWACRYKLLANGKRYISAILLPGDICDLDGLTMASGYGLRALTSCTLAEVPHARLRPLLAGDSALRDALWQTSLFESALATERALSLARRLASERIGHLFCELAWRLGAVVDQTLTLSFPLTQEEVGDALGLTPVHVNRSLQRLRDRGLISLERNVLRINSWDALQRDSGFDPRYLRMASGAMAEP